MVVMADLGYGGSGEVLQRPHPLVLLLFHVWVQVYPGCLREMQGFQEAHWAALYIKELCAEVQWIFALQESVNSTTAIHSFNAAPLLQSNPLADWADVEEKGHWWNFLLAVVNGAVKDLQCLQSPMHDLIARRMTFDTCSVRLMLLPFCTTHTTTHFASKQHNV